jgi:hypothetical protein
MNDGAIIPREAESDMQSIKSLFNNMNFELQSANMQSESSQISPKIKKEHQKGVRKSNFQRFAGNIHQSDGDASDESEGDSEAAA